MAIALMGGLVTATACEDDNDDLDDIIDDRLDDLDIDDDLVVTRDEWNNAFIIWDDDSDRLIRVNEFRFSGGAFEIADINNDGYVTGAEWEELLDVFDIDNDDLLEMVEFDPYL